MEASAALATSGITGPQRTTPSRLAWQAAGRLAPGMARAFLTGQGLRVEEASVGHGQAQVAQLLGWQAGCPVGRLAEHLPQLGFAAPPGRVAGELQHECDRVGGVGCGVGGGVDGEQRCGAGAGPAVQLCASLLSTPHQTVKLVCPR